MSDAEREGEPMNDAERIEQLEHQVHQLSRALLVLIEGTYGHCSIPADAYMGIDLSVIQNAAEENR